MFSRTALLCCVAAAALWTSACGRTGSLGSVSEVVNERFCDDNRDDDVDGLVDCLDPDCAVDGACLAGDENCGNGRDDDGDNLIDCDDPDCLMHRLCRGAGAEDCANGQDDDGDLLIDCSDPDCVDFPDCRSGREDCRNGLDDDGDNAVDCADPDCANDPACLSGQENCGNKVDDDGDGAVDCDDSDCVDHRVCNQTNPENCENGLDDDLDGRVDCLDLDCSGHPACGVIREICANGRDDDGDGKIDCDDSDCRDNPICAGHSEICTNRVDDDEDRLVDCDDPDCFQHPTCKDPPGSEICNNGIDDDEDGQIDCEDSDCSALPICKPGFEDCDNGRDDDGDGAVDCADPDCADDPACIDRRCKPTVNFGLIPAKGGSSTRTLDNTGTADIYDSACVIPGGGEVVSRFEVAATTDVRLSYEQLSGDHVLGLFRAGIDQACNENQLRCLDPQSRKTGTFVLNRLGAGSYYLFAEAFSAGLEGRIRVTLSTGAANVVEICNNGIDDDGDGAVDCSDLDCALSPACDSMQCRYDENVGSLVIDGPVKTVTVDTRGAGDDIEESCAGEGGADRVIRLVMPATGGLAVQVLQGGWHVYGLHRDKGPGTTCLADRRSCFDSNDRTRFTVAYDAVERGVYYYGVDALDPTEEGPVTLRFQAYDNRGPELCTNGIDDDGDRLVDCLDPDCIGVQGCQGPVCAANLDAGVLSPRGRSAQLDVDTRSATDGNSVSCAFGGGRDVVVAFELTEVSGLHVRCNQTGDHVLGLFGQGKPRDACDEKQINCADPTTGPIACNFVFPNLQPGQYYLIVEAFRSGDEGEMDLVLRAVADHAQEICNNGVDDDGDGQTDCRDPNCANEPVCEGQICVPDLSLGVLQKGGPVRDLAVTTGGATNSTRTECAQADGGGDSVIGLTLTQSADLQVDFAQFGDHVFAVYENEGEGLPCDTTPLRCETTDGEVFGTVTFADLPAGEYYMVVDATRANSAGSASLRISAK